MCVPVGWFCEPHWSSSMCPTHDKIVGGIFFLHNSTFLHWKIVYYIKSAMLDWHCCMRDWYFVIVGQMTEDDTENSLKTITFCERLHFRSIMQFSAQKTLRTGKELRAREKNSVEELYLWSSYKRWGYSLYIAFNLLLECLKGVIN